MGSKKNEISSSIIEHETPIQHIALRGEGENSMNQYQNDHCCLPSRGMNGLSVLSPKSWRDSVSVCDRRGPKKRTLR